VSDDTLRLSVIIASVRESRYGPVPAQWFLAEAEKHGQFTVDEIDLAEAPPPLVLGAEAPFGERPAEMLPISDKLEAADAFVVVTPEYNHGYPASLKSLIDWHFTEWRAKPVGFVSYGGIGGGLRAVEQLRLVFAEMHSVGIRDTVSFHKFWECFATDESGEKLIPQPVDSEGPTMAAKVLLDQLVWWAVALRDGRRKVPYEAGI
jgi:NAD(P)H-dependent FMN reductase